MACVIFLLRSPIGFCRLPSTVRQALKYSEQARCHSLLSIPPRQDVRQAIYLLTGPDKAFKARHVGVLRTIFPVLMRGWHQRFNLLLSQTRECRKAILVQLKTQSLFPATIVGYWKQVDSPLFAALDRTCESEVNQGELSVRSGSDSGETRIWELDGRGAAQGNIRIRAVGLEPEDPRCSEDTGTDDLDELEAAMREAEEARRLAEQETSELDRTSAGDDDTPAGGPEGFEFTELYYSTPMNGGSTLYTCSEYTAKSSRRVIHVRGKLPPFSIVTGYRSRTDIRMGHVCPVGHVAACTYRNDTYYGGSRIGYNRDYYYAAYVDSATGQDFLSQLRQRCAEGAENEWHGQ